MAYISGSYVGALTPEGTAVIAAENAAAAVAVHGSFLVEKQCRIKAVYFYVSIVCLAGTTAPVVRFLRRPTYGSTTGQVVLGTITIPSGTAAGKVMYKLITPTTLFPGETLTFEHTVQAADPGTPTCSGYYGFEVELDPEVPANQPNLVLSA